MEITHNRINRAIQAMERVVSKGQPFAKANKDRTIRAILRWMIAEQTRSITLKEICFYFWIWVKGGVRRKPKEKCKKCLYKKPMSEMSTGWCYVYKEKPSECKKYIRGRGNVFIRQ